MSPTEPRSETEIRAGLAVWQSRRQLPGEDVGPVEHPPTVAALRLLADVEPLLDALSAALAAKAELEQENERLRTRLSMGSCPVSWPSGTHSPPHQCTESKHHLTRHACACGVKG